MTDAARGVGAHGLARTAATGTIWLSTLNGLGGALALALNAWLNRNLADAPVQIAIWALASTFLLFVIFVFELGIGSALMQRKDLDDGTVGGLARVQLVSGLVGAGCVWLAAPALAAAVPGLPTARLADVLRLLAPVIAVIAAGLPPKSLLQRDLRFRRVALIEGGSTLAFVAIAVAVARRHGVEGLVLATACRHALETVAYWLSGALPLRQLLARSSWERLRRPLGFGISMASQSIVGATVRQADALLVGVLAGPVVALYRYAQAFVILPFSKLLVYAARAAFPTFARVQDDPERARRGLVQVQRLAALTCFPALAGLAAVAPRLLALFLGPAFAAGLGPAVAILRILAVGAAAFTYAYAAGVVMNAIGANKPMTWRQAAGAASMVALMVLASPGGVLAISGARSLANGVLAVLFLDLARRRLNFTWADAWATMKEAVPASLAMGALVAGLGAAADRMLPTSTASAVIAGAPAGAALAVLAGQVLVGVAAYAALLRLLGCDVVAEVRRIRGSREGPVAAASTEAT